MVLSMTVLPGFRLRRVFGEPSLKRRDIQQVCGVFCRAADVLWCWPLLLDWSLLARPFNRWPAHQLLVTERKYLQIILLLLCMLCGERMDLLRWLLFKHRSTFGKGSNRRPLAFRSARDSPQKATDLQVLGALVCPQVFSVWPHCNMSTIKPLHRRCSSEMVAEGKQQTRCCFHTSLPHRPWQAAEVHFLPSRTVLGNVWSKAMGRHTMHQPSTFQRDGELHLALCMVGVGKRAELSYLLFHNFIEILGLIRYLRMTLQTI